MLKYRFVKHPAKVDYRTLRFKNYLTPAIAAPPAAYNVLDTGVHSKLKTTGPAKLLPIDGNDSLGVYSIAALAHTEAVYHGLRSNQTFCQSSLWASYMGGDLDSGARLECPTSWVLKGGSYGRRTVYFPQPQTGGFGA